MKGLGYTGWAGVINEPGQRRAGVQKGQGYKKLGKKGIGYTVDGLVYIL